MEADATNKITHEAYRRLEMLSGLVSSKHWQQLSNGREIADLSEEEAQALITHLQPLYDLNEDISNIIEQALEAAQTTSLIDTEKIVSLIVPPIMDMISARKLGWYQAVLSTKFTCTKNVFSIQCAYTVNYVFRGYYANYTHTSKT